MTPNALGPRDLTPEQLDSIGEMASAFIGRHLGNPRREHIKALIKDVRE